MIIFVMKRSFIVNREEKAHGAMYDWIDHGPAIFSAENTTTLLGL
jgi:hypothetical protein